MHFGNKIELFFYFHEYNKIRIWINPRNFLIIWILLQLFFSFFRTMWLRNRSLRWIMMDRREMRRIWMGNRPPNGSRPFPTTPHRPLGLLVPPCATMHVATKSLNGSMISEASYTTSCYDAQVAPGPIHPPVHDDVRSDLSSSCYDVQVSPGHFNSLRQQWWPFHGGPIWWPAADAVYPISSWSASATNRQSSQNQRPSLASIHVANCSRPMSAGHTNAHPRRRLGGWQRFSRKINKRK